VPRYFFTIRGRDRVKDDARGTNLPDFAAALSNAERKIRELRKESGYHDPTLMMIGARTVAWGDLHAYANAIARRPGVQRGYKVPKDVGEIPMP